MRSLTESGEKGLFRTIESVLQDSDENQNADKEVGSSPVTSPQHRHRLFSNDTIEEEENEED